MMFLVNETACGCGYCSHGGTCNHQLGFCTCSSGYVGPSCNTNITTLPVCGLEDELTCYNSARCTHPVFTKLSSANMYIPGCQKSTIFYGSVQMSCEIFLVLRKCTLIRSKCAMVVDMTRTYKSEFLFEDLKCFDCVN